MPDALPALLRVEDVSRQFGGLAALDHVSFDVAPGTICGLIGPNGAGKTTLINIISGLTSLSSGRILFAGAPVNGLPAHELARRGIGRTFQNIRLFGDLSVLENVMVGHHLRQPGTIVETLLRLPRTRHAEQEARRAALTLLRRLGLDHLAPMAAEALSYGDQRRVEIARALAAEPRLLLLDEPAAGMIGAETEQLAAFLMALRAAGLTLLVIEHHMDLIMSICDQVVALNFGRKIAAGTADAVHKDPHVIEAYLGEEQAEA